MGRPCAARPRLARLRPAAAGRPGPGGPAANVKIRAVRVRPGGTGLELVSRQAGGSERRLAADRVVAAAGTTPSPPDSAWTWTRSWAPPACLAPLIDPDDHSCGTVRPHGVDELTHPEPGSYAIGMKSYGRAPRLPARHRLRTGPLGGGRAGLPAR
ncbi:hypothetical protein ACFSTC_28535 [Nonomuraea ferruginea]